MHEFIIQNKELIVGMFFITLFIGVLPMIIIYWAKALIDDTYKNNKE